MISASLSNETRKKIYRRDGWRCALCDSNQGIQVHHIKNRSQGGSNDFSNLITLCWRCHAAAHGVVFDDSGIDEEMQDDCMDYMANFYPELYQRREDEL